MDRFVERLLNRRVPQILGAYLGCSWGVIEFMTLIVDRYLLSPHLIDLSIVLLALFVPSVCMLAWTYGQPGDDEWGQTETVGLSLNSVGSLIVLAFLFGGEELGEITKTVSVTDEGGTEMEKEIPKSEFRKEVALFYFENESGDPSLDWAQYGLPIGLETDLDQDMFVRVGMGFAEKLRQRGFEEGTGAPLTLKQDVAQEARKAHFLTGSLQSSKSGVKVEAELRETDTGDVVGTHTYTGQTVFDVVDQISGQLRKDLEVPSAHLEQVEDLPVSELTTESLKAFQAYAEGHASQVIREDAGTAQQAFETAVRLDSTFALAHWRLADAYQKRNQGDEAERSLSAAMDHLYKLPQRYQFEVKDDYYRREQQPDKRLSVAEMRVELYPEDVEGHISLASIYQKRNRNEDALEEYQRVLDIAPSRHRYHDPIGDIYKDMGRYEEAQASYREYAQHFPNDADPLRELGDLFRRAGKLDSAATYFEKAHLLKPENVNYVLQLGLLETFRGNFETASRRYEEALSTAETSSERRKVLMARLGHYRLRGQIPNALEVRENVLSTIRSSGRLSQLILIRAVTSYLYAEIGEGKKALQILDKLKQQAISPLDRLVSLGRLDVYQRMENADALEKSLSTAEAVVQDLGIEAAQWSIEFMRGEVHRLKSECQQAHPFYEEALSYNPKALPKAQIRVGKAQCHRRLGQMEEAKADVQAALQKIPAHPELLREKALIHRERGERDQALAALEEALRVYKPADSSHVGAARVRALHDEFTSTSVAASQ